LYDTVKKTEFTINRTKPLRIYVCGPTVYTHTHVFHAKTYITFDIIRRVMEDYFKIPVQYMMNITNVDDKIIKSVYQLKYGDKDIDLDDLEEHEYLPHSDFTEYADYWEKDFLSIMDKLNMKRPTVMTRVTDYINEIFKFVEEMNKNGYTFVHEGSVYFKGDEDEDPKNPKNFVLLKKSKPHEPSWSEVRPIECSAMISAVFGSKFDIHCGGINLHNEVIQSVTRFYPEELKVDKTSNIWFDHYMHTGHLNIDGCKMSRSLKNFITVKDILAEFSSNQLRMLFLLHKWNDGMDYSEDTMKGATYYTDYFTNFFTQIDSLLIQQPTGSKRFYKLTKYDIEQMNILTSSKQLIDTHLRNNIDTPSVIKELYTLTKSLYSYMKSVDQLQAQIVKDTSDYVFHILETFGIQLTKL